MDAFNFHDPQGGADGVTHFLTLRTVDSLPPGTGLSDEVLDQGHGACEFQWQDLREMMADVLLSLDGECYKIGDFVIMPNHVHLLVGTYPGRQITDLWRDWIGRSTELISESRGRSGIFWHAEPVDCLVKDWDEFDERRKFIKRDPKRADLRVGEFYHHIATDD
jgi:putative transposase